MIPAALADLAERYLTTVLDGGRDAATDLVLEVVRANEVSLQDLYDGVLAPAQRELGRLWASDRISVAEEHLVSATTQFVMASAYGAVARRHPHDGAVVAAGVEGDLHEIGLRMFTDLFSQAGWQTRFVGSNAPTEGILELLTSKPDQVLAVSATMPEYLPAVRALVGSVKERSDLSSVRVVVGGRAFDADPEMAEWVGADFHAPSAAAALAWLDGAPSPPDAPRVEVRVDRAGSLSAPLDDLTRLNEELVALQRRLAQDSLALAEQARRTQLYLGTTVRDLRGSVAVVQGVARRLFDAQSEPRPPDQVASFAIIDNTSSYMLTVLDAAERASHEGGVALARTRVELGAVLEACRQRAAWDAAQAEVSVVLETPEAVFASVDVRRFEQIVDNLLSNAIRCAPKGTSVQIDVLGDADRATVRIEDAGPPVSLADRMHLFRSYDLGEDGGVLRRPGMALVRNLVAAHGGTLRAETAAGGGAAFVVVLPAG